MLPAIKSRQSILNEFSKHTDNFGSTEKLVQERLHDGPSFCETMHDEDQIVQWEQEDLKSAIAEHLENESEWTKYCWAIMNNFRALIVKALHIVEKCRLPRM